MAIAFSNVEVIGDLDESSSVEWYEQKPDRAEFKREWETRNWAVNTDIFVCLFLGVLL